MISWIGFLLDKIERAYQPGGCAAVRAYPDGRIDANQDVTGGRGFGSVVRVTMPELVSRESKLLGLKVLWAMAADDVGRALAVPIGEL